MKDIIETAVDGIITIDTRGTIQTVNPAVSKLFGYTKEELVGQNVNMLMPEQDRVNHDHYLDKYEQTGKAHIIGKGREVVGKRKDGSKFPFLLSISEVEISKKRIYTGIIHDLSELKEVRDALKKEMELNELKSRFITMASHEFRTPLSAILSSASLISKYNERDEEEKRQKHVDRIKSSVANLTGILNDFLSLSKLEEGKVQNTPVSCDIQQLAREVMEDLQPLLKDNQLIDYQHKGTGHLLVDNHIIKYLAANLLSNAIKYSAEGKPIEFHTTLLNNTLQIKVKDQGIGIPQEDKVRLFTRFFRAKNAANVAGTGLGLNIVKKYVDLLDGKVEFESQLNQGSTFTITIPLF